MSDKWDPNEGDAELDQDRRPRLHGSRTWVGQSIPGYDSPVDPLEDMRANATSALTATQQDATFEEGECST